MAPRYLAGRPSLGPANSVIFILSVFLFSPLPPCNLPPLLLGAAPGSSLMDGPRQRPPGGGDGRRRRWPARGLLAQPDPTSSGRSDLAVAPTSAPRRCSSPGAESGNDPSRKRAQAIGEGVQEKTRRHRRHGQCQAGMAMGSTKGLGQPQRAGVCLGSCLPVPPTPGKTEPTPPWGVPPAPREPRLVFQSRRAGIFSVRQISLMAQR